MNKIYIMLIGVILLAISACGKDNDALKAYKEKETLSNKQITVINLWAPWCGPCRQEIPELSRFAKDNPEIGVVGIAFDKRKNIEKFLKTTPTSYPIRYLDGDATGVMMKFGNKSGGIPYTMVYAPSCDFKKSHVGPVNAKQIKIVVEEAKKECTN
ncbi:MAG: redoxin domain-containing protein [Neisseriaceae bacterium]|nr:redoxin domain-containing protein [Neisseriaceae bacterium]